MPQHRWVSLLEFALHHHGKKFVLKQGCIHRGDRHNRCRTWIFRYLNPIPTRGADTAHHCIADGAPKIFILWIFIQIFFQFFGSCGPSMMHLTGDSQETAAAGIWQNTPLHLVYFSKTCSSGFPTGLWLYIIDRPHGMQIYSTFNLKGSIEQLWKLKSCESIRWLMLLVKILSHCALFRRRNKLSLSRSLSTMRLF